MKKLLISILVLLSLSAILWLGASWLIGVKTEELVKQAFSSSESETSTSAKFPAHTFPAHILIDYQRNWFAATAVTRLDVRDTPLSAWVDELQFQHQIEHGPLLWQGAFDPADVLADLVALQHEKLLLALLRWRTQLDSAVLDTDIQQWLATAFADKPPFSAFVIVDYEKVVAYQANLAAFEGITTTGEQFKLTGMDISGQFNPETRQPIVLAITSGLLELASDKARIYFPELTGQVQVDKVRGIRQLEFSAPQSGLELAGEPGAITFALQGKADYRHEGEQLRGRFELALWQFMGMQYPLNKMTVDADFSGVDAAGFYTANKLHNRLQDLQSQLVWNAEEIEMPEARRDQIQLELAIDAAASQLLQVLFNDTLQKGESRLQYSLTVDTDLGDLSQRADLSYKGAENGITAEAIEDFVIADWLGLLRGKIELDMAQAMVPAGWRPWLTQAIGRSLQETEERYQMNLRLSGYDAELNDQIVTFAGLRDKFMPPLPVVNDKVDLDMMPEILALIEAQALTPEILQQLADEDELSAATLDRLRQLQAMSEQLQ